MADVLKKSNPDSHIQIMGAFSPIADGLLRKVAPNLGGTPVKVLQVMSRLDQIIVEYVEVDE